MCAQWKVWRELNKRNQTPVLNQSKLWEIFTMHQINWGLMITANSFPVAYINPNVNQERGGRREMALGYVITPSGEGDWQGREKPWKPEESGRFNTCCPKIPARAAFGNLRDKKSSGWEDLTQREKFLTCQLCAWQQREEENLNLS